MRASTLERFAEAFFRNLEQQPLGPGVVNSVATFLGRIDEDAGHLEDAARSYGVALALVASAQSARFALSHVRLRSGDTPGARAEVETSVGAARRRPNS